MNLKKFAIRGIVILAIFVALCIFFSGTVRTITTPKVNLYKPKRDKLEESITLVCKPAFPNTESVGVELSEGLTLTIVKVNSRVGYTVEAGEVIVEAKVTDYDTKYKQYQQDYDTAAAQLLSIQNKNRNTRINQRDQAYADAYYGLQSARHEALAAELEMDAQLSREKLTRVESGYPEGASEDLKKLIDAWRTTREAYDSAIKTMENASRYNIDENVWAYISEREEQQEKLEEAEKGLRMLVALNDKVKAITAPHDGYLADLKVNEGDENYNGTQPMFSITPEDTLPTLRADLSNVKRTVSEGMTVTMEKNPALTSKVIKIDTDAEGKKYADIEANKEIIKAEGSIFSILDSGTNMILKYNSKEANTLLATSMVQGTEDNYYVFVAKKNEGAFDGNTYTIEEMKVTEAGRTASQVAVKEDLTAYLIAYGWDRKIQNGSTVMEYVETSSETESDQ